MNDDLKNSVVTITGGTGSFGKTMTSELLSSDVKEVRIFSRDEEKQDQMRNQIKDERLRFFIGDVRDSLSVDKVVSGSDYVFHAAALKQVPSCEFFPNQAVSTNVIGSSNILDSSFSHGVRSVVLLSTDKAVYPINAMGMSKALMEKVAQSYARLEIERHTRVSVTRYGNVLMSRGSVVPLFLSQIRAKQPITITDPKMTRFIMSLDESVDLVKFAMTEGSSGSIYVKKAPACTIKNLAEALIENLGHGREIEINEIGIRHGEKEFETLISKEEMATAIDHGEYFQIPLDSRSLDYQIYFDTGKPAAATNEALTSNNTKQLSVAELVEKLESLPQFLIQMKEILQ